MPASVTYDEGDCWTLRMEFSTNHWRDQRFCPDGDVLVEEGGSTFQRFDFVALSAEDLITFTCDGSTPGTLRAEAIRTSAEPGDVWEQSCTGRSEARGTEVVSAGTNTFVGVEELDIGGRVVGALHYRLERDLSGDQEGRELSEHWYSVTDGLLLRATHDVEVSSPSPVGDVGYTERGELRLTSLEPRG